LQSIWNDVRGIAMLAENNVNGRTRSDPRSTSTSQPAQEFTRVEAEGQLLPISI